jgi:hypothetical protein
MPKSPVTLDLEAARGESPQPPLRIALAGFLLESVTFLDGQSSLSDFRVTETSGSEMVADSRGTNS